MHTLTVVFRKIQDGRGGRRRSGGPYNHRPHADLLAGRGPQPEPPGPGALHTGRSGE